MVCIALNGCRSVERGGGGGAVVEEDWKTLECCSHLTGTNTYLEEDLCIGPCSSPVTGWGGWRHACSCAVLCSEKGFYCSVLLSAPQCSSVLLSAPQCSSVLLSAPQR